jgi:LmbE family N-acetylglucosaminyl deacetylase
MEQLAVFDEDWQRALAIVAHPDDMEYGAASAVARWTGQGKEVAYLLVTKGEAGISSMSPAEAGPLRMAEQEASCAAVGVQRLDWLDHPDGLVENNLELRKHLARSIRRHRPEIVVSGNYRDSWGGPSWNHADHRAVGRAVLDAIRDASNPWLFADLELDAWDGVKFVAFGGSPESTHAVDISDHIQTGVDSLLCHRVYLENLGGDMADAGAFLRTNAQQVGPAIGVELAVSFEVIYV